MKPTAVPPTHTVLAGGGSLWHPVGEAYMERDGCMRVFLDKPVESFRIEPIKPTLWQRLHGVSAAIASARGEA